MLNAILHFSLKQRLLVIAVAVFLCAYGAWTALYLPIDVFPDLDRPRVVIMTEAMGMAPEEVETRVTFPIETAVNGANGVQAVRSTSSTGLSVIYVEFDFGVNVFTARQIVNERLATVIDRLPKAAKPQLAPISSIMGQILVVGMWNDDRSIDPLDLRTQADWIVRQRLLSIPGVAQVFTMGGGRKQFQVQVDPESMRKFGIALEDIRTAVENSNENATGGYLDQRGPSEWLVRAVGRIQSIDDIKKISIAVRQGRPVSIGMVASVVEAPQVKRGDSAAYIRNKDGKFSGGPAIVFTISKQPGADTRAITDLIMKAIEEVKPSLSANTRIEPLYAQEHFIDRAVENVMVALRDGGILVVIILFLFLMNFRTTFISLTAIPLSLLMTVLVFKWMGLSINTMTLGGLAVAIGELVDDAIVDVENIFRRLKENSQLPSESGSPGLLIGNPKSQIRYRKSALQVVYEASLEVRSSIVFSTIIVCLVFLPLFALSGMEGRLFSPLGVAYVVSILSSLVVSLTVTPILSYWLLPSSRAVAHESDGFILRFLKWIAAKVIRFSLQFPWLNLIAVVVMVGVSCAFVIRLDRDFLPPFNEGAIQLNVLLPPGTSLATTIQMNQSVEDALVKNADVTNFVRRTGRAELDEHAEPVSASEYIIDLDPKSTRAREQQLNNIREDLSDIPGIVFAVEQPISHLISHMLSGVKAQIGVKLYGDDLDVLRAKANQVKSQMQSVRGVRDLMVEQQVLIPQLKIDYDRDKLLLAGLNVETLNRFIETAMNGQIVSEVMQGQRTFDLVVRFKEDARENIGALRRLAIELPSGGMVPLESLAKIYDSFGPNTIQRERIRRRIVIQCNTADRGLVEVVEEIQAKLRKVELPQGYYFQFSGQFESQQRASRMIFWLFGVALVGVFLTLFTMFRSINLSLQVMAAIPMAFIGSVAAIVLTGQNLTIASMVGFISLGGIASRNGILLLQHYLHLVRYEGEEWSHEMIVRAGLERLAPVLMTALTAGIGLVPLVLAAGQPGKEILYPVATVILGGVISSTLLDFFVHPALFWLFGLKSAQRTIDGKSEEELYVASH